MSQDLNKDYAFLVEIISRLKNKQISMPLTMLEDWANELKQKIEGDET